MELNRAVLRMKAWVWGVWTQLCGRMKGMPLRRVLVAVVALSLWMGTGSVQGSTTAGKDNPQAGAVFGEIHWYEGE